MTFHETERLSIQDRKENTFSYNAQFDLNSLVQGSINAKSLVGLKNGLDLYVGNTNIQSYH